MSYDHLVCASAFRQGCVENLPGLQRWLCGHLRVGCQILLSAGCIFRSPSVGWARDRGLVRRPPSPLPFWQHHQGGEDGGALAGCNLGWLSRSTLAAREPRLRSRLTAQLVPSASCQPVASQPGNLCAHRRPLWAQLPPAPRAAALRGRLPPENSPSLVPSAAP